MPQSAFDLEEEKLSKAVYNRKAKLVLIQLPEGLKPQGPRLATTVEKAGAIAILSADPCYGACDLAIAEAERLGADLIVHYAHSELIKQTAIPTIYIEARARVSVKDTVKKALPHLKRWRKIGIVTTLQHVHQLEEARRTLLDADKTVAIGDRGVLKHPGQVIGCDYSNAKAVSEEADAFLFLGGGKFHAIGVALATAKPVIVADPYEKRAFTVNEEAASLIRKRWANIHETEQATEVGILIGLKIGQKRLDQALRLKKRLECKYRVVLLALREITPEALMQFPSIDAFVNTACPRISLDDSERFDKPLLTPEEALVALGELKWEELCKKGWLGN
ncbi:MAG: diphthamide biosynthesis enzyme Dph2 [Candidatus Bathyarchaeia archaeon]